MRVSGFPERLQQTPRALFRKSTGIFETDFFCVDFGEVHEKKSSLFLKRIQFAFWEPDGSLIQATLIFFSLIEKYDHLRRVDLRVG